MSFGYNLAPLFKEKRKKILKAANDRPFWIGRVSQGDKTISSTKERFAAVNRMRKIVCGMQAKEAGYP